MAMTATETATPSSRLAETALQTSTYEEVTKQKQRIVVIETDKKENSVASKLWVHIIPH